MIHEHEHRMSNDAGGDDDEERYDQVHPGSEADARPAYAHQGHRPEH